MLHTSTVCNIYFSKVLLLLQFLLVAPFPLHFLLCLPLFPQSVVFLAVALVFAICRTSEAKDSDQPEQKPNVLFIAIDELDDRAGAWTGIRVQKTPNISAMAREEAAAK